jgi:hypothetical protein
MATRTSTGLSRLSFQQLQTELRRRHRKVAVLQRRRDRIARKVASLDELIAAVGGTVVARLRIGPGRGRARNEKPLAEALHEVLKGSKPMRVTDLAEAVQKAGYKTNSRTFRVQVNIALVKRKDLFKRVGRGQYTAK